ncbi:MAG: hypothetical protein PHI97_06385 [Desulfobulbus sp.]|nr:hypothetical protein [Desulfobulbus sp.]
MMRIRRFGWMALLLITGCAPQHTVIVQSNTVVLTLHLHEVDAVGFSSSLDQFAVHKAREEQRGQWVIAGLPNRDFQYFYLVDGKVLLPECRFKVKDDFGAVNCRYLP